MNDMNDINYINYINNINYMNDINDIKDINEIKNINYISKYKFIYKFTNKNYIIYNLKKIIIFIVTHFKCFIYYVSKYYKQNDINEKTKYYSKYKKITEKYLYDIALKKNDNNLVTRQLQENCYKLYEFDKNRDMNINYEKIKLPEGLKRKCYGCNKIIDIFHSDYIYSCIDCGNKFRQNRYFITKQTGKIALVIGARTKLGHQIAIKLLKSECTVIVTSRYPDKMVGIYEPYEKELTKNLVIYNHSLDLDSNNIKEHIIQLYNFIDNKFGKLDILINSAAQTIRSREKNKVFSNEKNNSNKYGELKYANNDFINSWNMTINDITQNEMEEIFRTNVIGPTLMIQTLLPLLSNSLYSPFIINVHAREGLITVKKTHYHIHTNYGKTCLHMLTKCLISNELKTKYNKKFTPLHI